MKIVTFSENLEALMEIAAKVRESIPMESSISSITTMKPNMREEMGRYGINKLYVIEGLRNIEELIDAIMGISEREEAKLIILESNKVNKEVAIKIAVNIGAGYIADCIDFKIDVDGKLIGKRMVYASKAVETIKVLSEKAIMTVPRRISEPKSEWNFTCEIIYEKVKPIETKTLVIDVKKKELSAVPLESAEVIVAVGRGVKKKEDCKIMEELAKILGGVISCSRPVAADLKWFNEWIGLSGHKVSPKLYIAVGISGAIQHLAGIQNAKVVVAINKDSEAPIIKSADYGVVADLYEFIPKFIERLKSMGK
ncbi:MAG: electron transfer flavoprotein subunit alpha/FixB family protein [Candidatus Methanomethylicia archaeon]